MSVPGEVQQAGDPVVVEGLARVDDDVLVHLGRSGSPDEDSRVGVVVGLHAPRPHAAEAEVGLPADREAGAAEPLDLQVFEGDVGVLRAVARGFLPLLIRRIGSFVGEQAEPVRPVARKTRADQVKLAHADPGAVPQEHGYFLAAQDDGRALGAVAGDMDRSLGGAGLPVKH